MIKAATRAENVNQRYPGKKSFASLIITALVLTAQPALANPETDFAAGMEAYRSKHFKVAASFLQNAANAGYSTPELWMHLGHAYIGCGDKENAVEAYSGLVSNFRGTPAAAQAIGYIQKLDPEAAKAAIAGPLAKASQHYIDRIYIVKPLAGHPAVSKTMIAAVKETVRGLPPHIYQILDKNGATINLAPNIEDRWPGSGEGLKPGKLDVTMGEEPSRTYDHNTFIYERQKLRGVSKLGSAYSTQDIKDHLLYEVGHALDDIVHLHKDRAFLAACKLDFDALPIAQRVHLSYYTNPGEASAAMVSGLLGSTREDISQCMKYLPHCRNWMKAKLKL